MGKILVIAEKPSVAKDIAKVLACDKKGDGFLYSNSYVVSWAIGHLVTLCEPEDYSNSLKRWHADSLPIIPDKIMLKPINNTKKQFDILTRLMNGKDIDKIICATDSGREGELIFRYVYTLAKCTKSFERLWISSMTDAAIKDGFKKLKPGSDYDNLYTSARCRSEADWLVGINATRAFTVKYNALLSVGRVQTPTLAIIVEKQKEINAFVPVEYFEVNAIFLTEKNETYKGKWFDPSNNETKLPNKDAAEAVVDKVNGGQGVVNDIQNEEKRQVHPLLYDLTELQRDCNRKFGFSAQKTLSIAQDLYEKKKMITYPRTDSRYLSDDMKGKITNALDKLDAVEKYKVYTGYIKALNSLPLSKRIIDNSKVTDHHAIIPTDIRVNLLSLGSDEFKVYDLIVRRFLCVFYPVYIYNVTKIITVVAGEQFLTKGSTVVQYGWMELYKDEKDKSDDKEKKGKSGSKVENEDETVLPPLNIKDKVSVSEVSSEQKKTQPPKPYNEATLLSAMENAGRFIEDEDLKEQMKDSGLGTPATRAAIIERLLQVGYLERKGKALLPTDKGMKLIEVVPPELKSPETTGKWEKGLMSISKGGMDDKKFMGSIHKYVRYIVAQTENAQAAVIFPSEPSRDLRPKKPPVGICPDCGGGIYENTKAFFCERWKESCKFTVWKEPKKYDKTAESIIIDSGKMALLLKEKEITINNVNIKLIQGGAEIRYADKSTG